MAKHIINDNIIITEYFVSGIALMSTATIATCFKGPWCCCKDKKGHYGIWRDCYPRRWGLGPKVIFYAIVIVVLLFGRFVYRSGVKYGYSTSSKSLP